MKLGSLVPARELNLAAAEERSGRRRRGFLLLLLLFCFGVGAVCGAMAMKHRWPPYWTLRLLYYRLSPPAAAGAAADLRQVIVHQPPDVGRLRSSLIRQLWAADSLPGRLPDLVERNVADPRFSGLANLARLDRLTVRMEFGLDSRIYRFVPRRANGNLILYHRGHDDEALADGGAIERLLSAGYEVVAFWMPLFGDNARPVVRHPRLGLLRITFHDQLAYLRPARGDQVKFFIEPVIVTLNHLLRQRAYRSVAMVGLSGGGWTTTLAAALDPRIARSFPVAGSYPIGLLQARDFSDFEQTAPSVYTLADYYDLYILGASGAGRRQLQILNEFDPCCFSGRAAEQYRDPLNAIVRAIGPGSFDVMIDSSHARHEISPAAWQRIIGEIGA